MHACFWARVCACTLRFGRIFFGSLTLYAFSNFCFLSVFSEMPLLIRNGPRVQVFCLMHVRAHYDWAEIFFW
jgi:hypothetical protein